MPFDQTAWQREMLQHCLWIAGRDPTYAKWAARRYEQESAGALRGLVDKVDAAIAKHMERSRSASTSPAPSPASLT